MWLVFRKELKELIRDRKTLFFMIALPILIFPALIGVVGYFSGKAIEDAQSKVLKYYLVGAVKAPEITAALVETSQFERVDQLHTDQYADEIESGAVDFVVEIADNYSENVLTGGQSRIKLYFNDASLNLVYDRVEKIVEAQSDVLRDRAFDTLGIDREQQKAIIQPIVLEKVNTADLREIWGERIGGALPYFIFILCLQGAMFPAADIGAGEKERGTLETLLISPIERYSLVLGKFFTIAFAGVTAAMITVISLAVWGTVLSQGMALQFVQEFMVSIGVLDFVLMFLMLIPVVAIFASILLSMSIYARSYKEAQSYMGTLMIVVIFPIVLAMLPGVELKGGWAWVPLTNVSLAIKELIKGTMDYFQLIAIFSSTALIALAAIGFCVYWFNREKVLFR